MYKLLLILKYLRRKLAPLFAAVAVMLCTAMVIIVMSVMGGFLDQFRVSARNLTGDVIVESPSIGGFEGYEELLEVLEELPEIAIGTPSIETFGLVNFGDSAKPVRVQGVNLEKFEEIVGYRHTLLWKPEELLGPIRELVPEGDPSLKTLEEKLHREHPIDPGRGNGLPEAVIGVEVNPLHSRDENGQYAINKSWAMRPLPLTVVPVSSSGTTSLEQERRELLVVNEFKSGLFDIDGQYVFLPFETLQSMLGMDERKGFDPTTIDPQTGLGGDEVTIPGRANRLILKAAPGFTVEDARNAAQDAILIFYGDALPFGTPRAYTWEDVHSQILGAVQNEKGLITFLFGVIGIVAIVMVATTFYMIVLEKTRDIGVLRAIGASRFGIIQMFLGYGLAIGVVGSLLGLLIAVGVVTNLNEIQDLIAKTTGWRMWNPQTYFFDRIPDQVDYAEAWFAVAGAVVSSVIGATLPALLAGRLKPVEALRYE
ncbi:MAG: FtsX-like permease family protein [Planctomycetota bacterium]